MSHMMEERVQPIRSADVIVALEMLGVILAIMGSLITLIILFTDPKILGMLSKSSDIASLWHYFAIVFIAIVLTSAPSYLLLFSVRKAHLRGLGTWLFIQAILFLLAISVLVLGILTETNRWIEFGVGSFCTIYRGISIGMITKFAIQVRRAKAHNRQIRREALAFGNRVHAWGNIENNHNKSSMNDMSKLNMYT